MITQVKSSLPLKEQYSFCTAMIFCFTLFLQKPIIVSRHTKITFFFATFFHNCDVPLNVLPRSLYTTPKFSEKNARCEC